MLTNFNILHKIMKRFAVIIVIVKFISFCKADTHSWGQRSDYNDHRMYERVLIDDQNSIPRDYTIIYKYYGAHKKPVAYIEITVNTNSSGHMSHGTQASNFQITETIQTFDATVHIENAQNIVATLRIYGVGMNPLPYTGLLRRLYRTKSLTFIYVKTSSISTRKPFARNSIGTRRVGDELLHFESRKVKNNRRFPSRVFEYSGGAYITYVGFSFNSPTAMVMVNTSFVNEQEFNAVVYDINAEHFVANMSVYGIKSSGRPESFLGVI